MFFTVLCVSCDSPADPHGARPGVTMTPRQMTTIDDYIAGFPPETQALLQEVRGICREEAPRATETISYGIPTFDLDGRHLCHFAAFKNHLGFYPTDRGAEAFADELTVYKGGKGTVQFSYKDPLPVDLIRRMVHYRVVQVEAGGR
jgi:uncharacterized protein YdhG (YjbR/CyaY superfamily)